MDRARLAISTAFSLLSVLVIASDSLADWPHWRGPARNGVVTDSSGWDEKAWPLREPAWTAQVGEGSTSPLVVEGKVYVSGWSNGQDILRCLDLASGKELWKASSPSPRYGRFATGDEGLYSGVTATPEYDPGTGLLYTLGCDGDLVCRDLGESGAEVWRLNLYDQSAVKQRPKIRRSGLRDYGYTTSPLVQGDALLVEVGAEEGLVMAFDKRSGKRLWKSEHAEYAGHTGGLTPMTVEGAACVAVLALRHLVVMQIDGDQAGKTVATWPWETDFANNILTPTVRGQSVLVSSYHTHHKIARLDIAPGKASLAWEQPYASHTGSPVIDGEHVYLAGAKLHCLDWQTGRELWSGGNFGDGGSCVLTGDGRLIVFGANNRLALVESARRSADSYHALAELSNVCQSDAWCHVTLCDRRLLCKDRSGLIKCWSF